MNLNDIESKPKANTNLIEDSNDLFNSNFFDSFINKNLPDQ